jgi:hypothetical protein
VAVSAALSLVSSAVMVYGVGYVPGSLPSSSPLSVLVIVAFEAVAVAMVVDGSGGGETKVVVVLVVVVEGWEAWWERLWLMQALA